MMVNRNNVCSLVITYNPERSILDVLITHLDIFSYIIIVDNGSSKEIIERVMEFCQHENRIELICLPKNYGIAYALNIGIMRVLELNFKWLVSFDQDSIPSINLLDYYNIILNSVDKSKVRMIGGAYTDSFNAESINKITWRNSLSLITSGTLYNVDVFKEVGLFDDKLFIDGVDFDYNLRVREKKYLTIRIDQPIFQHHLGDPIRKYFLGMMFTSTNHSPERRYFFARNHVIISKKYFFKFPIWILKKNYFFIQTFFQILIVEKNVKVKINRFLNGLKDGLISH